MVFLLTEVFDGGNTPQRRSNIDDNIVDVIDWMKNPILQQKSKEHNPLITIIILNSKTTKNSLVIASKYIAGRKILSQSGLGFTFGALMNGLIPFFSSANFLNFSIESSFNNKIKLFK